MLMAHRGVSLIQLWSSEGTLGRDGTFDKPSYANGIQWSCEVKRLKEASIEIHGVGGSMSLVQIKNT